jgi:indolepyruvate ferredoxin oxidoreductase beta subunit
MNLQRTHNIIITGVGGQGNVLASQILGHMLVQQGYEITIGETYGASQRGGSVMSHIRVSQKDQFSPLIPEGKCDLVVGLEPVEALRVLAQYGNPEVHLLINTRPIYPIDVIAGNATYPELSFVLEKIQSLSQRVWTLNATEIALEMGDHLFKHRHAGAFGHRSSSYVRKFQNIQGCPSQKAVEHDCLDEKQAVLNFPQIMRNFPVEDRPTSQPNSSHHSRGRPDFCPIPRLVV